ncbi:hypothetical protein V1525DRAFT_437481 [Lipomyces kononenkoae]|uniref:Uncharacterized protein n=1 Tax=Lipomyces kononenkoae TaxID=34357 RepID=A0ACC3ST54_LIPKO
MDALYGSYDPHSASASRATSTANATRARVKRKAADVRPEVQEVRETNSNARYRKHAMDQSKCVILGADTDSSGSSEISKGMSVTDSKVLSNFNDSFTLIKENVPEQRLDIQLPYEKFLELDAAFSEMKSEAGISEEKRYPSLAYNSLTETVTVTTTPAGIHEGAARRIETEIISFAENYLSTHSPHSEGPIGQSGSTTMYFGQGGYHRSYVSHHTRNLMVAIEVGTSEKYSKLCADKDMWINGKGVNVVILICINESPRFRFPAAARYRDIVNAEAEIDVMGQTVDDIAESNAAQDLYGPLRYKDHKWVGKLNDAFIEVWRANTEPVRNNLIQNGSALDNVPNSLIRISDLYPRDAWEAINIPDASIPFDNAKFLRKLRNDMVMTAVCRFERFLYLKLDLH